MLTAALALAATGCASKDGTAAGGSNGAGTTVHVALADFSLSLDPTSVPAGPVTLAATNAGPSVHEFEVFSVGTGLDANALPVKDDVAVTDGLTVVDEIEEIVPGSTPELTLDLKPGTYAVLCDLPGHYAMGMHATFTVA